METLVTEREWDKNAVRPLAILRHAEEVTGNAALTCRHYGITRQTFYQWQRRYKAGGQTLSERLRRKDPDSHRPGCNHLISCWLVADCQSGGGLPPSAIPSVTDIAAVTALGPGARAAIY
jgi:hypothetical protein